MKILLHPHPVLKQISEEIHENDIEYASGIILEMITTMELAGGIGLAAPQIGESIRAFVTGIDGMHTIINPKITEYVGNTNIGPEGCLSLPGLLVKVQRHPSIIASWVDINGVKHIDRRIDGYAAKVFQHEYDHLDGILTIDKYKGDIIAGFMQNASNIDILDAISTGKHIQRPVYQHLSIFDEQ